MEDIKNLMQIIEELTATLYSLYLKDGNECKEGYKALVILKNLVNELNAKRIASTPPLKNDE